VGANTRFITSLVVPSAQLPNAPAGAVANLVVECNPLIYAWNLPVLVALLLASNQPRTSLRILLGLAVLLPVHVWGVSFDVLKRAALTSGPAIQEQLALSEWQREAIALGYQFGYLMLPIIASITIWIALNRPFISHLLAKDGE